MQGLIAEVLAAWREAERVAGEHPSGTIHDEAVIAALKLRELYQELVKNAEAADAEAARRALDQLRLALPRERQVERA